MTIDWDTRIQHARSLYEQGWDAVLDLEKTVSEQPEAFAEWLYANKDRDQRHEALRLLSAPRGSRSRNSAHARVYNALHALERKKEP